MSDTKLKLVKLEVLSSSVADDHSTCTASYCLWFILKIMPSMIIYQFPGRNKHAAVIVNSVILSS